MRGDPCEVPQIHSVPAEPGRGEMCGETRAGLARPALRPYVLGYAGFRSAADGYVRHRVLPLNLTTLIVDFDGDASWVTGPRRVSTVHELAEWRHGVAIGLTPAGACALLGVPVPDLVGATLRPDLLLGRRAPELAERLAAAPGWPARFALLDELLTAWILPAAPADDVVTAAWWRLQRPGVAVGAVAGELGVSRRRLELGFQRRVGLSPKTVARIARFQRATHRLSRPGARLARATEFGYADQAHFTREVREMTGVTPTELFAFLQYIDAGAR